MTLPSERDGSEVGGMGTKVALHAGFVGGSRQAGFETEAAKAGPR